MPIKETPISTTLHNIVIPILEKDDRTYAMKFNFSYCTVVFGPTIIREDNHMPYIHQDWVTVHFDTDYLNGKPQYKINWACFGSVPIEEAEVFHFLFNEAIETLKMIKELEDSGVNLRKK